MKYYKIFSPVITSIWYNDVFDWYRKQIHKHLVQRIWAHIRNQQLKTYFAHLVTNNALLSALIPVHSWRHSVSRNTRVSRVEKFNVCSSSRCASLALGAHRRHNPRQSLNKRFPPWKPSVTGWKRKHPWIFNREKNSRRTPVAKSKQRQILNWYFPTKVIFTQCTFAQTADS